MASKFQARAPYFLLMLAVLVLDRWTKALILSKLNLNDAITVIDGFFDITYVQNTGVAFSMFSSIDSPVKSVLLSLFTAAAAVMVVIYSLRSPSQDRLLQAGLGLILGGALALLNYKWLHSSLRAIVAASNEKAPPGTMVKFVVRWLVIATIALAANKTGYFDAVAILAGLFVPAGAVMVEAAYVAYKTLRTRENDN